MNWSDVRGTYPDQWLIVEALAARTEGDQRIVERLAVMERCRDGEEAFRRYRLLHLEFPQREFYFVHTSREELVIRERQWLGIRRYDATAVSR